MRARAQSPKVEAYECSGGFLIAFVDGQWSVYERTDEKFTGPKAYAQAWRYVAKRLGFT